MSKPGKLSSCINRFEGAALRRPIVTGAALAALSTLLVVGQATDSLAQAPGASVFNHATSSSPIAMSADNKLVWSVNPNDDSVSVIRTDTNALITNIKVGDEPESVALDPGNKFAYVANAAGSSVTVIKINNADPASFNAAVLTIPGKGKQILTGAEPWNVVTSPNGKRVFVANSGQDTITVIDGANQNVIGQVDLRNSICNDPDRNRRFQPRGLAVTQDNTKLYVTRFFSFVKPGGQQGTDDGREGLVCRLDIDTNSTSISGYKVAAAITLAPRLTGFAPAGLANEPSTCFPNQVQSVVIRGNQAYLPNICASPTDPLVFNNETMSFVNIIDNVNAAQQVDASLTKFFLGNQNLGPNLHLGAQDPEPGKKKLFFANPWAIGFTNQSGAGAAYVVSAASDLLVKVNVAADGTISFTGDANTTRYIDLNDPANAATSGANAGKNPIGIVVNDVGTTAYVNNFVSRSVSVVNLTNDSVARVIKATNLPAPGSKAELALVGAEQFFSSRGHYNQPAGTSISIDERLSKDGWQGCSSCHFKGLTDSVVWSFNTGPRKSISLDGTFDPHDKLKDKSDQRLLNYSAIRDEVPDFDPNIRDTSGPGGLRDLALCSDPLPGGADKSNFDPNHGLFLGDTNAQLGPCVINNLADKANGPGQRNEITVTLPGSTVAVPAWTALNEWVRVAVRTPNAPLTNAQLQGGVPLGDIIAGRVFFQFAGCQTCHGGNQWTTSILDFTPPPNDAVEGFKLTERTGNFAPFDPSGTQYLNRFLRDIKSFDLNVPGSGNAIPGQPLIGAVEKTGRALLANGAIAAVQQDALGKDYNNDGRGSGFSPPSLLGIGMQPPYYHNGACETLACVLENVNHRTAGNGLFGDVLADPKKRAQTVKFLESIDTKTTVFNR